MEDINESEGFSKVEFLTESLKVLIVKYNSLKEELEGTEIILIL